MNVKTTVGIGVIIKKDEAYIESKSLIKWRIPNLNNVCAYLGLKYSMDGWAFLAGMKIGGVKLLFPVLILNPATVASSRKSGTDFGTSSRYNLEVLVGYFLSSCCLAWLNRRKQKQMIAQRKEAMAPRLEQHDQQMDMIRAPATKLQKRFKREKGFVILRAYYGLKVDIQKHLELSVQEEDLQLEDDDRNTEEVKKARASMEKREEKATKDLMIINVTMPVRYALR